MKLENFVDLWEKGGFKLVQQSAVEKEPEKLKWVLFSIHLPYCSADYGRHMAALVVVDKNTEEILAHDTKNTSYYRSGDVCPWTQEVQDWFDRHVAEGIEVVP